MSGDQGVPKSSTLTAARNAPDSTHALQAGDLTAVKARMVRAAQRQQITGNGLRAIANAAGNQPGTDRLEKQNDPSVGETPADPMRPAW
jgi:hypothetical protein